MNPFFSMKPFQLILLAVFGALAIIGLILFANFGGFGASSTKIGTVSIWGTLPQSSMENVINALRSGNQEYTGVSYTQKPKATFDTDLAEAIASGNGPDLILISQEELATEQNKLQVIPFSSISERTYIDTYLPIEELFLATDGTYGIPFAVDPLVLYYNRPILFSVTTSPPNSWESITSLTEQMTHAQGSTITQSTIPFGAYDNIENARAVVSLLLLQSGTPITSVGSAGLRARLNDSGTSATTPAVSAISFYSQFADPVKTVYTWNRSLATARQSFLAGNLAFYPGFASELPSLKAANPNLDFDMAPIPQPLTATPQSKSTFGMAYAFSVPKASKNSTGAVTVAFALANSSLAPTVAQALSMAPATKSSLTPSDTDRYTPVYFPQARIAKAWLSPSPTETDRIFSTMIGNISSGKMGIGEALNTANQAIDAAL